jgi:UDP-GlcNAc:undecaprenyl-phosphate GlcNAc-1-phosphate transferase
VSFPASLYALSLVSAGLATALSLPLWRSWCRRVGLVDEPGLRKIHDQPIALAGGLAMLTGLLVSFLGAFVVLKLNLLGAEATEKLGYGLERRFGQLAAIAGGALGMTILGWLDDKHELRPAAKFAGQLFIAGLVAAAGIRITLFISNPVFSYGVTILWILTVTNAFNFMDNMNGLCAGLGGISSLLIGLIAARHGHYLVAALAFLVFGAVIGFLPFNFPHASAFLGDAGSHLIGFLMSVLSVLPHFYSDQHPRTLAVLSPLLILAVPLVDIAWVVVLRWRMGKPFYIGDTNHLSHRLVRRGLSGTQAVMVLWFLATAVGSLALLL